MAWKQAIWSRIDPRIAGLPSVRARSPGSRIYPPSRQFFCISLFPLAFEASAGWMLIFVKWVDLLYIAVDI